MSREISAYDELDGEGVARERYRHVRVGHAYQVVRRYVSGLLEEERRYCVQHLPLKRDGLTEHVIERRYPVGRNENERPALTFVDIAHLALVPTAEARQIGLYEGRREVHRVNRARSGGR